MRTIATSAGKDGRDALLQVAFEVAGADVDRIAYANAGEVADAHQEINIAATDVEAGCDLAAIEKCLFHVWVPKVGWLNDGRDYIERMF